MITTNSMGRGRASAIIPRTIPLTGQAEAKSRGGLFERLDDDGVHAGLLVMAPHGGQIEPPTDLQALRVLEKLRGHPVSSWRCEGYHPQGGKAAFDRFHITSTEIAEASFPLLARIARRRFRFAVSFHGMLDDRILVGGAAPTRLKTEIRDAIRHALGRSVVDVDLALPGDPKGGRDPKNVVNRYAQKGGVQIEQSLPARQNHWKAIADAVAKVYASRL